MRVENEGGAGWEQAHQWFTSNFESGQTIEIAEKTDKLAVNTV
jgi:hypothetical protein